MRLCIALFAVSAGWLLLDIGWFVLFSLSRMWYSDPWPTVTSQPIRLSTYFMTLIPSLTFTELWVDSMEHLQRVWHASREHLPFRTPGFIPQIWNLLVIQLLRPDSLNLPCLYSFIAVRVIDVWLYGKSFTSLVAVFIILKRYNWVAWFTVTYYVLHISALECAK